MTVLGQDIIARASTAAVVEKWPQFRDALQIVPVSSNVSWANTPVIALYCTQYKALFGSVNLKEEMTMKMSGVSYCSAIITAALPPMNA